MYTPENITSLIDHEVFVFGSNGQGNHCGGSARVALEKFGAINGQPEGLQGQSFAINTMDGIDKIKEGLNDLVVESLNNPNKVYYLTKIGCRVAGYTEGEIISLLPSFPANVIKPLGR